MFLTIKKREIFKKIFFILLIIIGISLCGEFLLSRITPDRLKEVSISMGAYGPLVITGFIVISQVIAPIASTPGFFVGVALYGPTIAYIILYIAGLLSSVICFYISRIWGRSLVEKFVGKKGMKTVDNFVEVAGGRTLVSARLIGYSLCDVISYATGFTNISFKKYFLITVLFSAIPNIMYIIFFSFTGMASPLGAGFYVLTHIIATMLFFYVLHKQVQQSRLQLNPEKG